MFWFCHKKTVAGLCYRFGQILTQFELDDKMVSMYKVQVLSHVVYHILDQTPPPRSAASLYHRFRWAAAWPASIAFLVSSSSHRSCWLLKRPCWRSTWVLVRERLFNTGMGGGGTNLSESRTKLQPPLHALKKSNPPQVHKNIHPTLELILYIPKFNCFSWKQPFYYIY